MCPSISQRKYRASLKKKNFSTNICGTKGRLFQDALYNSILKQGSDQKGSFNSLLLVAVPEEVSSLN